MTLSYTNLIVQNISYIININYFSVTFFTFIKEINYFLLHQNVMLMIPKFHRYYLIMIYCFSMITINDGY